MACGSWSSRRSSDPELVPQAVFTALGLQDHSSSWALSTLGGYLADKRPLLILDNCEHVHEAAAALAGTLLRACPDLRILATSRQALGVTGEVVVDVPTLSLPEDRDASPEAVLRSDAVALFVDRAAAVQPGFAVDATNAATVLSICRHVEGIPLALELAAVRLSALGLEALDRGLAARLGALGTGDRSVAPRQQTLEGAIDWSYQLLSEPERLLWARLSVFAGGFELDAAQAVCAADGLDPRPSRSSSGRSSSDPCSSAARVPTAIASGSSSRSASSAANGSGTRARRRASSAPADWILGLASMAGANDARQAEALDRIRIERANLWAALDVCMRDPAEASAGAEICRSLWICWVSQGPATDVAGSLRRCSVTPAPGRARGRGCGSLPCSRRSGGTSLRWPDGRGGARDRSSHRRRRHRRVWALRPWLSWPLRRSRTKRSARERVAQPRRDDGVPVRGASAKVMPLTTGYAPRAGLR